MVYKIEWVGVTTKIPFSALKHTYQFHGMALIRQTGMPWWWAQSARLLFMVATTRVIRLYACIRYWPYRFVDSVWFSADTVNVTKKMPSKSLATATRKWKSYSFRAFLRGGEGPQLGEVTRLGRVIRLSIYSLIFVYMIRAVTRLLPSLPDRVIFYPTWAGYHIYLGPPGALTVPTVNRGHGTETRHK